MIRRVLLFLSILSSAGTAAPLPAADSLVIIEADVDVTIDDRRDAVVLPSAARSDAVARHWPAAAIRALRLQGPAGAWRPPGDLRHHDPLTQVLALQEAVALALLEPDVTPRALSLGDTASLARSTGATHALFARIRAAPRGGDAVAMLVDLRSGEVLRHRVRHGLDGDAAPDALAADLARRLLAGWRGVPTRVVGPAPGAARPVVRTDVERATARLEQWLRRDPRRIDDPALEAALHGVGCRLDPAACDDPAPIVLRAPEFFAATLPGGQLVIRTGLLSRLRDEAEFAFVIAHEHAHERHDDVAARLAGTRKDLRGESARLREVAADRDAVARLAAAGYDPGAVVDLWTRLLVEDAHDAAGPGSHPPTAERLAAARALAGHGVGGQRGAGRWAALIDPRRAAWQAGGRDPDGLPAPPPLTGPRGDLRTLRVLGLRLSSTLPWRQRPGIGAVAWTVDGTPLNRLTIVSGIHRGATLLHDDAPGAPRWDGDAAGPPTVAAIVAALRRSGWADVAAGGLRPDDFGGLAGTRASLTLATDGGLHYRGMLAAVVRNDRLTWVVWAAPEAVYYPRDAAEVAAMLDGMTFGSR